MALDTYNELKLEIASFLNRDDLTSQLDTFIDLTETRHARDLRIREMEAVDTSITTVAGTQEYNFFRNYCVIHKHIICQMDI